MANTLRFKRGLVSGIPTAALGEPLFTTDTFDLYIGNGTTNTRFQKYIASGATTQILRGDGSLYTFPLAISSPSAGQVLKYNGTSWVNDSDAGITGSGTTNYLPKFTGASTLGNSLVIDNGTDLRYSGSDGIRVQGTTNGFMTVYGTTEGYYMFTDAGGATGHIAYNHTSDYMWFKVNGSEAARITSSRNFIINNSASDNGLRFQVTGDGYFSGSVGIGTSSPARPLHVNGTMRIADGSSIEFGGLSTAIAGTSSSNALLFYTSSAERLRLDSSGNLGLGVTPSAWSGYKSLDFTGGSIASSGTNNIELWSNAYFDGTNGRYRNNGFIAVYSQTNGQHRWLNAPSGTAGNAITFTQAMTLDASGRLSIGSGSVTSELLQVNGTMKVTGASTFGGLMTLTLNQNGQTISTVRNTTAGTTSEAYFQATSDASSGSSTFGKTSSLFSGYKILTASSGYIYNGTAGNLAILNDVASGSIVMAAGGSSTAHFTIASTGAATFSSSVTAGGNLLLTAGTASSIGAINLIRTGTSPVASRLTFGTDGTGYSFAIGKNQAGSVTDLVTILDTGAATFSSSVTCASLVVDSTTLVVDATNNRVGVGTNAPTSSLHVVGSVTKSHTTKTANYTMTESDYTVLCDTTSGGFTISLPAASGCSGRIYVIKKITGNSGTNNITIDPNGSETIDGATTYALQCRSNVIIQSDGSNWWILAERVDNSCI